MTSDFISKQIINLKIPLDKIDLHKEVYNGWRIDYFGIDSLTINELKKRLKDKKVKFNEIFNSNKK